MKNRIAIFVFYDKDGIVEGYVEYLLKELKENVSSIICLSNSKILDKEKSKLEKYCDKVILRENKGLDAAAYKQGMIKEVGWEKLETYDDVIILNDTFFGPFIPFKTIFDEMDSRKKDFWGLSYGPLAVDGFNKVKYGYIPNHIQTFFVSFSQRMVKSKAFHSYWDNYDDSMNSFVDVVTQHEMIMTKYFEDRGFKWDVYSTMGVLNTSNMKDNYTLYAYTPYKVLKDYKFPFIKRKIMNYNVEDQHYMNESSESEKTLEYVRVNYPDYEKYIWEDVLRLYNISDLYYCLHFNEILSEKGNHSLKGTAVLMHLTKKIEENYILSHLESLSEDVDIYLVSEYKLTRNLKKNFRVLPKVGVSSPMAVFMKYAKEIFKDHEYIINMHDYNGHFPGLPDEESVRIVMENLVLNDGYIASALDLFEKEKFLGLLTIKSLFHHENFDKTGNLWYGSFDKCKKYVDELEFNVPCAKEKVPLNTEGAFIVRKGALDSLLERGIPMNEFSYDAKSGVSLGEEAFRRLIPYAAQAEGYYTKTIMNKEYASMHLVNLDHYADRITALDREKGVASANIEAIFFRQKETNEGTGSSVAVNYGVRPALAAHIRRKHKGIFGKFLIGILGLKKY